MKVNFLKETIVCLNRHGRTEKDVLWVGRGFAREYFIEPELRYWTTWEDFSSKADFDYDNSFGLEEIPDDIVIVGEDFWLERQTYDGSEWWEFKTLPARPAVTRELDIDIDSMYQMQLHLSRMVGKEVL